MEIKGDTIKEIFKIINIPYVLITIISFTGLLLFLPDRIIKKIYLDGFRNKFGEIIGAIFLISLCLLIMLLFNFLYNKLKDKIEKYKQRKGKIKYLLSLDDNKTKIIKDFIKEDDHTLSMDFNNGVTQELEFFQIITKAGSTQPVSFESDDSISLVYFLQPWVIALIEKDKKLKEKFKVQ